MVLKFMIRILLYTFLTSGFLYQAVKTSITFFSFRTTTRTSLNVRDPVLVPDFAICARTADVLLGNNFKDTPEAITNFSAHHTIGDMLRQSPDPMDIIESCVVRTPNSYKFEEGDKNFCYDRFKVTKYVYNEFVCFELHYKNQDHIFRNLQVSRSELFSGILYYIALNRTSPLNDVALLKTSSYFPGDLIQYQSLDLAQDAWTRRSKDSRFNYFVSQFQMFQTENLEAPYDTNCLEYSMSTQEMCIMDCVMARSIERTGAIPSQVIVSQPIDFKHIDERNESLSRVVDTLVDQCTSNHCSRRDCHISVTVSVMSKNLKVNEDSFRFLVGAPYAPDTTVVRGPDFLLSDYVLFTLSLAGSWFGFSILGALHMVLPPRTRSEVDRTSQQRLSARVARIERTIFSRYRHS